MDQTHRKHGIQSDPAGMMRLLNGAWATRLVHAAAELGVADHLADGERDAPFLAAATSAHAPSLARLLRALTAIGVLFESDRRYSLTPLGATLRSDAPGKALRRVPMVH